MTGGTRPGIVDGMDKLHSNWVGVIEAARILGCTPATLRRHIKSGVIDLEVRVHRVGAQPKLWRPDLTPQSPDE